MLSMFISMSIDCTLRHQILTRNLLSPRVSPLSLSTAELVPNRLYRAAEHTSARDYPVDSVDGKEAGGRGTSDGDKDDDDAPPVALPLVEEAVVYLPAKAFMLFRCPPAERITVMKKLMENIKVVDDSIPIPIRLKPDGVLLMILPTSIATQLLGTIPPTVHRVWFEKSSSEKVTVELGGKQKRTGFNLSPKILKKMLS